MISFSGIDCAGKSTQIEKLAAEFAARGEKCRVIHSRGGYTPLLEAVKTLLRPDRAGDAQEHERYRAAVHGNPKKRKLLLWLSILDLGLYYGLYFRLTELFGTVILADRYIWDSYIDFQMKYPEFDFEHWGVWRLTEKLSLKPEKSLIYTIPAELSMYRSTLKDEPWPEPVEVRRDRIARYEKELARGRWQYQIDASGTLEQVYAATEQLVFTKQLI